MKLVPTESDIEDLAAATTSGEEDVGAIYQIARGTDNGGWTDQPFREREAPAVLAGAYDFARWRARGRQSSTISLRAARCSAIACRISVLRAPRAGVILAC